MARGVRSPARPMEPRALGERDLRRLLVVCLTVGSNLPDADLLYTSLTGGPLAYALHHRGYTHTLPGAILAALLLWVACWLWLRHRQRVVNARELGWLAAAALTGVLLHLGMDYTNSYGVHPFWPFYDGWLYGDSMFIVEPVLWLAAAPLIFLLDSRLASRLVALAVGIGAVAVTATGLVAWPAVAVFLALMIAMLAAARWLPARVALGAGIAAWLGFSALGMLASQAASARLQRAAAREFPGSHTVGQTLTPAPANPLCWEVWLVQTEDDRVLLRQARLTLLPALIPVRRCRGVNLAARGPARGEPIKVADRPDLVWLRQFSMPGDRIARLAAMQCQARAFMQFARVPMADQEDGRWWLADLRFGSDRGFSRIVLHEPPQPCDFVPVPWLPPRPELLRDPPAATLK